VRLGIEVCRHRLAAADRAFLASTGADLRPHLVPVTFALAGDELVIAIDQKPKSTTVRADGAARIDQQNPAAVESLAAKYPPYRLDPPRGPVITVMIDNWSGWSYS
jgi:hypothetical protein